MSDELIVQYDRRPDGSVICFVEICAGKDKPHTCVGVLSFTTDEQWQLARRAMRLGAVEREKGIAVVGSNKEEPAAP